MVTTVRADGAEAVSEIEGGDAVVAGVAPGAHSLTSLSRLITCTISRGMQKNVHGTYVGRRRVGR